ncbi:MAG: flagellar biosynthesis anti-sigma factor FlgM [Thermodesulfobacteriota bacterium]
MKINPSHVIKQVENVQKKQPAEKAGKTAGAREGDKVVFSEQLREVQDSQNDLSVDAQRQERIQAVKEQIANGSYSPDPVKVAESLVKYVMESGGHA